MTDEQWRAEVVTRLAEKDLFRVLVPAHGQVARSADGKTAWVECWVELRDYTPEGR